MTTTHSAQRLTTERLENSYEQEETFSADSIRIVYRTDTSYIEKMVFGASKKIVVRDTVAIMKTEYLHDTVATRDTMWVETKPVHETTTFFKILGVECIVFLLLVLLIWFLKRK